MELEYGGRRYSVANGDVTLGADPNATVVLTGTRPRHAVIRALGDRMATIRAAEAGADISVNGVALGPDPTPLMDGDTIVIGSHQLKVLNPSHPAGGPNTPPPGARERLHDTLYGLPRSAPASGAPVSSSPPPVEQRRATGGRFWIVVAAVVSLGLLAWLLLR
jgi:hypothetical protein